MRSKWPKPDDISTVSQTELMALRAQSSKQLRIRGYTSVEHYCINKNNKIVHVFVVTCKAGKSASDTVLLEFEPE